ncbi:MAG: pilus assembly protein TadG-related protein [Actinomycetota bacterium]
MSRLHRDESGMVGKIIVIWLLLVVLLGVVALDTGSILFAKFRLSDLASNAATAGATSFRNGHDVDEACQAAKEAIEREEADQRVPHGFCKVTASNGEVVITLRKQAKTLLAGRLGFTEDLTKLVIRETGRPPSL